jgi:hypothetical protein
MQGGPPAPFIPAAVIEGLAADTNSACPVMFHRAVVDWSAFACGWAPNPRRGWIGCVMAARDDTR